MSSFKEIKKRINAIKSTRKTTSAMKMVSSSKLMKAESVMVAMKAYAEEIRRILLSLLTNDYSNPLSVERPIQHVAIIAFSSDSSLCGAYNSNISHVLQKTVNKYAKSLEASHIHVYTIGKKVHDYSKKNSITIAQNFENLAGKSDYPTIAALATSLIEKFEHKQLDRVELIYHHFKSAGSQELVTKQLLPIQLTVQEQQATDFILEPSREAILKSLIPKNIQLQLYTALLNANTSEHAARMIAMQTATDNADDLVSELTIEYNKSRQQAITNELLDIIGGSVKSN